MSASKGRVHGNAKIHQNRLKPGLTIGDYIIKQFLNHGAYGSVVLAAHKSKLTDGFMSDSDMVAIKCVPLLEGRKFNGEDFELLTLKKVKKRAEKEENDFNSSKIGSRNVVKYSEFFYDDVHCYIVLEYCSLGDIYEAIVDDRISNPTTNSEIIRALMLQIIDGVEFLHSIGVYHRDLKPENLLLCYSKSGVIVKISDFGLATEKRIVKDTGTGSDRYMSPEQYGETSYSLVNGTYDAAKADIWALGIVFLNILFAKNPFKAACEDDPIFADYVRDPLSLFDVFPTLSNESYQVLEHSLCIDPDRRSLDGMREAVFQAQAWTTDGEFMDETALISKGANKNPDDSWLYNGTCATADRTHFSLDKFKEGQYAGATYNRKPLRTPSICNIETTESITAGSAYGSSWDWDDGEKEVSITQSNRVLDEEDGFDVKAKLQAANYSTTSLATLWEQEAEKTSTVILSPRSRTGLSGIKLGSKSNSLRPHWMNSSDVSSDSGLGASIISIPDNSIAETESKKFYNFTDAKYASAPVLTIFFPQSVKGSKEHLKFEKNWCDLSDSEDDLNAELGSSSNESHHEHQVFPGCGEEHYESQMNAWDEEMYRQMQ